MKGGPGAADACRVDTEKLRLRLTLRLVLPLACVSLLNSLDRVNVSYAALQMTADLGMSPQQYGAGISIFFVAYVAFQLGHVWLLRRIGMRLWLCFAVFAWGCIGIGMAFAHSVATFYVLRFLLGMAEAGLGPAVTWYVSQWMPRRFRAWAVAGAMAAVPTAFVICGPLSGWLMQAGNPLGMTGWRWMFLVQSLPNLVLAFVALAYFVDRLQQARWLSGEEKSWLERELAQDSAAADTANLGRLSDVIRTREVWICSAAWFCVMVGAYGLVFWLPQVINQVAPGHDPLQLGIVSALPWTALALGMLLNAWHSDKTQERLWHVSVAALVAAICLEAATRSTSQGLALLFMAMAGLSLGATQGPFWAIPTSLFRGSASLAAIAVVNMAGTAGGIVGPSLIGIVRQRTGSFTIAITVLAAALAITPLFLSLLRKRTFSQELRA